MKILEVTFFLAAGGAERFLVDLSNELSKTNEVVLITLKDDTVEPERRQFYKFDLSDRVTYKNLGLPKGLSLKMLWTVYKAIKNEKPDVVHLHVHGVPVYCSLAIYLLCWKTKFYQTIHSDIHNGYTNWFYRILIKTVGYWKKMGFAALSETNYKDMMAEYPKAKSACIVNGRAPIVPTPAFNDVQSELSKFKQDEDTKLFIHVARCNPVKNQLLLVEAFSQFVENGANASLIIVGDGFDSELGEQIKAAACDKIHFVGPHQNVSDYVLNSDAFCLSSNFEGMPISMLEASLAGLPIVSTPVCGAMDLIIDGENGIKSKDYTKESYVEALRYVYENMAALKVKSNTMKGTSPYTIKECAEKYMKFFNQ